MNEQNERAIPEPGCVSWGCFMVVFSMVMAPCLIPLAKLAEENHRWSIPFLLLGFLSVSLVAFHFLWPHFYRNLFQPQEAERDSPEPSGSGTPLSLRQHGAEKSDEEFPWEAFAYGYLMHELLDDSGEDSSQDHDWGEEDHDADHGGDEDFWFYGEL